MLVLHHVPEPARALAEVARVLKPGGRVIVADMLPHDRDNYRQQMGHVWLGFSDEQITSLMRDSGFERGVAAGSKSERPGFVRRDGRENRLQALGFRLRALTRIRPEARSLQPGVH